MNVQQPLLQRIGWGGIFLVLDHRDSWPVILSAAKNFSPGDQQERFFGLRPQNGKIKDQRGQVLAIVALSAIFIVILLLSGYFERDVLALHLFQSLIYVSIIVLSLKHNKWGYGIGISIATLWNTYNIFSGFVFDAGFRQWSAFLSTGRITDPVHLIAPPAWFDHLALIVCLAWAYARLPNKNVTDIGVLLGSFVGVIGYFLGIIAIFWPQFLRH